MYKLFEIATCKNAIKVGAAIGLGYSAYLITKNLGSVLGGAVDIAMCKAVAGCHQQLRKVCPEIFNMITDEIRRDDTTFKAGAHIGF